MPAVKRSACSPAMEVQRAEHEHDLLPAGVSDEKALKHLFIERASALHPDRDGGDEEMFKRLASEYEMRLSQCRTKRAVEELEAEWMNIAVAAVANPAMKKIAGLRAAVSTLEREADAAEREAEAAEQHAIVENGVASRRASESFYAARALRRAEECAELATGGHVKPAASELHAAAASSHVEPPPPQQRPSRLRRLVNLGARLVPWRRRGDGTDAATLANRLYQAQVRELRYGSTRVSSSLVEATAAAKKVEAVRAAERARQAAGRAEEAELLASELAVLADVAREEAAERRRELEAQESLLSQAAADAQVVGEAFSGLSSAVGSATADAIGGFFMSSLDDRKQEAASRSASEQEGGAQP